MRFRESDNRQQCSVPSSTNTTTCDTDYETENCLGLLLPSCQITFCSFLLCFPHTHIQVFCFSLPFYHYVFFLSPRLAPAGQDRGERSADRGPFMLSLSWSGGALSQFVWQGRKWTTATWAFEAQSVTCPLAEGEKPEHWRPLRVWTQGCLPLSQVVHSAWRSQRFLVKQDQTIYLKPPDTCGQNRISLNRDLTNYGNLLESITLNLLLMKFLSCRLKRIEPRFQITTSSHRRTKSTISNLSIWLL